MLAIPVINLSTVKFNRNKFRSLTWKKTMQLLLFWIIQVQCSPRTKNVTWFQPWMKNVHFSGQQWKKHSILSQSSRDFTSNLGLQLHTAKTHLLSDLEAELKQGQDTFKYHASSDKRQPGPSHHLQLFESCILSLLAPGSLKHRSTFQRLFLFAVSSSTNKRTDNDASVPLCS